MLSPSTRLALSAGKRKAAAAAAAAESSTQQPRISSFFKK